MEWQSVLGGKSSRWLVTGCAGFIGSHLIETLLQHGQQVVGLDSFATGFQKNLDDVAKRVGGAFSNFSFHRGDIIDPEICRVACEGVDFVLHQAALGSVPRSIDDPLNSHRANVDGFVNMILAARDAGVRRFVYASSSSVYGDIEDSPKREERLGECLSPYAVTKRINELYANNFASVYGLSVVGLRYFNVFGPRQDPHGAYAAVIPRWIDTLLSGAQCEVNGDGTTSRDFCFVDNVVQANILSAIRGNGDGSAWSTFNVALGGSTSLTELHAAIATSVKNRLPAANAEPLYRDFRKGDVKHSLADISRIQAALGYVPSCSVKEGIERTVQWYFSNRG